MNSNDIAPCGIDCINCEVYEPNNRRDVWQMFAERFGVTAEEIACKGCRIQGGCSIHKDCETLECVKAKKNRFLRGLFGISMQEADAACS